MQRNGREWTRKSIEEIMMGVIRQHGGGGGVVNTLYNSLVQNFSNPNDKVPCRYEMTPSGAVLHDCFKNEVLFAVKRPTDNQWKMSSAGRRPLNDVFFSFGDVHANDKIFEYDKLYLQFLLTDGSIEGVTTYFPANTEIIIVSLSPLRYYGFPDWNPGGITVETKNMSKILNLEELFYSGFGNQIATAMGNNIFSSQDNKLVIQCSAGNNITPQPKFLTYDKVDLPSEVFHVLYKIKILENHLNDYPDTNINNGYPAYFAFDLLNPQ